ncbi:MAG: HAD family hydrolase, partial [Myxococcota bacterium]
DTDPVAGGYAGAMPVRAVVFDLFDTLVDLRFEDLPKHELGGRWLPASSRALHAAVSERAPVELAEFVEKLIALDKELHAPRYKEGREVPTGERFEALVEHLGIDDPELPELLTSLHMGVLRSVVRIPEHHRGLLQELGARVRLGLCSNFTHSETALGILEEAGFDEHLDAVVVSDAVGWRKPRSEIFDQVLRELDVAPDEVLHVGDSLRADVGGAHARGIRTAWITRRIADPKEALRENEGPAPDHAIGDLAEVLDLLD